MDACAGTINRSTGVSERFRSQRCLECVDDAESARGSTGIPACFLFMG
jgi:hypothetical protein